MPNIDFSGTSAYRDSTRGATIKALQLRQQKLQEETAAAQAPRQIASPWQGAAQIADVIGSSIREGRAANEEQAGRQRFAQLLAGGLTPDEMGEAIALDPETAMRYQEHTWDTEKTAAETAAREKEALRGHGWDVDAATARVQAEKEAAASRVQAEQNAAKLEADAKVAADKAARTGAVEDRDFAAQAQKDAAAARAGVEAKAAETKVTTERKTEEIKQAMPQKGSVPDIEAQFKAGGYGDPASPEAQKLRDADIAKAQYTSPTAGMTPAQQETDRLAAKEVQDWKTAGGPNARKAVTQVNQALDILDKADKGTGGGLMSATGPAAGLTEYLTPEFAERWLNPQGTVARDAIRETVQTTLRQVLGAQFTQQEGEALMNRAFATSAEPKENIRRAKLVMQQITAIAEAKQAQADWLDAHGTMQGYTGPQVDIGSLVGLDFGGTPDAGGATAAGGGTGGAPADNGPIVTIRRKEGT